MRALLLFLPVIFLCGFTTIYKNNPQTGRPDLVTSGVTVSEVSGLSGSNTGDVTLGTANGLSLAGQVLSLQTATNSQPGALTAADWSTFNGKQAALGYTPMKTDYSNAGAAPTWNQNTTGTAAKLTTPRAINGVNFDGSAPITINAVDSTARAPIAGPFYTSRGQITVGGSSTTTMFTLANAASNQTYILTVRQSGGGSNNVMGYVVAYGAACGVVRAAQSNTTGGALDMNLTVSGSDVQLVLGSGYGSTTWDWVLTQLG